jgi:hypothetical protein
VKSTISTANYSIEKLVTAEEQILKIEFKEIHYLTSLRLTNIGAKDTFYMTYQVTKGGYNKELRIPWYNTRYNVSFNHSRSGSTDNLLITISS